MKKIFFFFTFALLKESKYNVPKSNYYKLRVIIAYNSNFLNDIEK